MIRPSQTQFGQAVFVQLIHNSSCILSVVRPVSVVHQYRYDMPSQLIVADTGHFHAALLQKQMYPGVASRVSVYATLGPDILDYLKRISLFNSRRDSPTHWQLDVHLSEDPVGEMLRERPGNIVVFAGRNRGKIDRILASLEAGLNVLADKPWIISSSEMPKLEAALALAESKHLVAYDIMTER